MFAFSLLMTAAVQAGEKGKNANHNHNSTSHNSGSHGDHKHGDKDDHKDCDKDGDKTPPRQEYPGGVAPGTGPVGTPENPNPVKNPGRNWGLINTIHPIVYNPPKQTIRQIPGKYAFGKLANTTGNRGGIPTLGSGFGGFAGAIGRDAGNAVTGVLNAAGSVAGGLAGAVGSVASGVEGAVGDIINIFKNRSQNRRGLSTSPRRFCEGL